MCFRAVPGQPPAQPGLLFEGFALFTRPSLRMYCSPARKGVHAPIRVHRPIGREAGGRKACIEDRRLASPLWPTLPD
jgi:hypothetical protein